MATRDTRVVGVAPRMTREQFIESLRGTPAESEAAASYDVIVAETVDPLFMRMVFRHESSDGTAGVTPDYNTKSPGNTRTSSTGKGTLVSVPGKGSYVKHVSWVDGWQDAAHRLVSPSYPYAQQGAVTIEQIIPIWAPSSDNNSPSGYINAVVRDMTNWEERNKPLMPLQIRVAIIPAGNPNRPGGNTKKRWITVHETGNTNNGANAEMHRRFTHNGGGDENVSFQWVVDDVEAIQLLPNSEIAWHAGDGGRGEGNNYSIGIETCVNADGDWVRTLHNLAQLIAKLSVDEGIPLDHVVQHNHWSGKNCPTRLRQGGWPVLLNDVASFLSNNNTEPTSTYFPETGHFISLGFRRYWLEQGGLATYGYPITEEFTHNDMTIQYFERARFEHHPDSGAPYDVLLGLLGNQVVELTGLRNDYPDVFARRGADGQRE